MKSEHSIQNEIRLALSGMGWCVFRANVGKVKMADGRWFDTGLPAGFSDLFAVNHGNVVFLEVKKQGGRIRKDQEYFLQIMRERYGCPAGIVRSVEDAVKIVKEAENYEREERAQAQV